MLSLHSIAGGKRAVLLLAALLIAALVLLPESRQAPLSALSRHMAAVVALPLRALAWINQGVDSLWARYALLQEAQEETLALRRDRARLWLENARLREEAAASTRLRALLEMKEQALSPMVAAQVVGRDPSNWYRSVVINKGTDDGLAVDMGVVTPAGIIGRIVKVYDRFAIVLLLIDPNNAVTGLVQRTRDEGIVEGTEQGLARLKYLPLLSTITVGDHVVTSGLAGGFPRGLPIGVVTKIERHEGELFLSAEIEPSGDFAMIEEALVVTLPREATPLPPAPFPLRPPAAHNGEDQR